eukprot:gnl/TRDRNA2_/TRDRNA2_164958_c0_seq4.p1 gnl/TRDRNA2_/TRDRNA2_164958_c0~~gnl/TRDRNA2_/TRDRNA2_164958_c0_seq4.p1  ORF type:complete len:335 (+),score=80.29 gnl/TRDRNA2_/TRDRNA2_164958_c0_seq4:148-1005(+)
MHADDPAEEATSPGGAGPVDSGNQYLREFGARKPPPKNAPPAGSAAAPGHAPEPRGITFAEVAQAQANQTMAEAPLQPPWAAGAVDSQPGQFGHPAGKGKGGGFDGFNGFDGKGGWNHWDGSEGKGGFEGKGGIPQAPMAPALAAPATAPPAVPMIFRTPSVEEVRELLEQEGMPTYIALGPGKGFAPKRICLDGRGRNLYVLEADSTVPSMFFGVQGFGLSRLKRIVHGEPARIPQGVQPLVAMEFDEGFLMLRMGGAEILKGLVGALTAGRDDVEIIEREEFT